MKNPNKYPSLTEGSEQEPQESETQGSPISYSAQNVQVVSLTTENLSLFLERIRGHQIVPGLLNRNEN